MSDTYQVVCDRHNRRVVLADVWYDPECKASQRYNEEMRRWDRHTSGGQPIVDRYGRPYPPGFRPYVYRHSSRAITISPREHMFVPELVDRDQPDIITGDDWMRWLQDRAEGKPAPHDGYIRTTYCEIGDAESADGHEIRISCELCEKSRGKSLLAFASADTLAMVLDRIGPTLATEKLPVYDQYSGKLSGDTVEVRVITLHELRKELGNTPRG